MKLALVVGVPRDFPGLLLLRRDGKIVCEIRQDGNRSASDMRRLEQAQFEMSRALGWTRLAQRLSAEQRAANFDD